MKIKTTELISKETIDVTLTQRDILEYALAKLLEERPDLKGKTCAINLYSEGGPLGFLVCGPDQPFLTAKVETSNDMQIMRSPP